MQRPSRSSTPPALLAASLFLPSAFGQNLPTVMLVGGQPLPGVAGSQVANVNWLSPNRSGGISVTVSGTGGAFTDVVWGSLGGGSTTVLAEPGSVTGGVIATFTDPCGAAEEHLAVVANLVGVGRGVVVDGSVVAAEGQADVPGGGTWIRFDEPLMTFDGEPWFRGQFDDAGGRWGLFRGTPPSAVLRPGDTIPGMPGGVAYVAGGPEPGYAVSELGSHWMGVVRNSNGSRQAVVVDGSVLSAGGVPLVSWNSIPAPWRSFPTESWNGFGPAQILEDGTYAVAAYTPSNLLIRDGELFQRNGDVVDGFVLGSNLNALSLNRAGELAWICDVRVGMSASRAAVFREEIHLFQEGDTVDLDGDGVLDPGNTVLSILGNEGQLAITEDGTVWTIVRLDTVSLGQPEALIAVGNVFGNPYCTSQPNSSGRAARIQAAGGPSAVENRLRLRCVDLPDQAFGYFLCSRSAGFVAGAGGSQGDLCLGGSVGRFNASIVNSGTTGSVSIPVDLTAIPQPNGAVAAMTGESWRFQCWYRDANPSVTSNFSDGIEVVLR